MAGQLTGLPVNVIPVARLKALPLACACRPHRIVTEPWMRGELAPRREQCSNQVGLLAFYAHLAAGNF